MVKLYFTNLWEVIKCMLSIVAYLIASIGVVILGTIVLSWISAWYMLAPVVIFGSAGILTWLETRKAL